MDRNFFWLKNPPISDLGDFIKKIEKQDLGSDYICQTVSEYLKFADTYYFNEEKNILLKTNDFDLHKMSLGQIIFPENWASLHLAQEKGYAFFELMRSENEFLEGKISLDKSLPKDNYRFELLKNHNLSK